MKLARGGAGLEEGARHARCVVLVITVDTFDVIVGATLVLAGGRVMRVVVGKVLASTLVTLRGLGAADIGSMAPL